MLNPAIDRCQAQAGIGGNGRVDAIWRGIATNLGGIWSPPVVAEEGSGNPVTCTVADPEPLASNRFLRLRVILP